MEVLNECIRIIPLASNRSINSHVFFREVVEVGLYSDEIIRKRIEKGRLNIHARKQEYLLYMYKMCLCIYVCMRVRLMINTGAQICFYRNV